MSKRKRASLGKSSAGETEQKPVDEGATSAADDAATKEDMAHVSPDLLAGSPDIFAPKWNDPPSAESAQVVTEPAASEPAPAKSIEKPNETAETSTPILAPTAPP